MLQDERSLRLAVLNSCEGARTSHVDPFSGVASSLVECGIPAVIGMQFEITDDAAITFSERLYTALAQGYPVDAALAQARKAIFAGGHDIEFGTPVLFLRGADARLFDVEPSPGADPQSLSQDTTPADDGLLAGPEVGERHEPAGQRRSNAREALDRASSHRVLAGAAGLATVAIVALVARGLVPGPSGDTDGNAASVVTGPQATSLVERFATSFSDGDVADVSAVLADDLRGACRRQSHAGQGRGCGGDAAGHRDRRRARLLRP